MRPAVVVSHDAINRSSPTVVVAAMTRTIPTKDYPQNVHLEAGSPLKDAGTILGAQLITVDKSRLVRRRGELPPSKVRELGEALRAALDIRGIRQ